MLILYFIPLSLILNLVHGWAIPEFLWNKRGNHQPPKDGQDHPPFGRGEEYAKDHPGVHFGGCRPPTQHKRLPLFKPGTPVEFPAELVEPIISNVADSSELTTVWADDGWYIYDSQPRLVASLDRNTNETNVHPKLSQLVAGEPTSFDNVTCLYNNANVFPHDDTALWLTDGAPLRGAFKAPGCNETQPQTFLSTKVVQRNITVDGVQYQVCGPGSRGYFRVAANGAIHSLSHRWRSHSLSGATAAQVTDEAAQDAIKTQLQNLGFPNANVTSMRLCYYDSGDGPLEPVYEYISSPPSVGQGVTTPIIGRVAAIQTRAERDLLQPVNHARETKTSDKRAVCNRVASCGSFKFSCILGAPTCVLRPYFLWPTLGRYVRGNADHTSMWIDQMELFFNAWNKNFNAGKARPIGDSQYYKSSNVSFYTTQNEQFIDDVNIAITEDHGNIHGFGVDDGWVALSDIATKGNGLGNKNLRYWWIDACQVMPATEDFYYQADKHFAWDDWAKAVFNGTHAVSAYRTLSFPNDGMEGIMGDKWSLGQGYAQAYLDGNNAMYATADWYDGTAFDGDEHLPAGQHKCDQYGQANVMTVQGHEDDTIYQRDWLKTETGNSPGLHMWWNGRTKFINVARGESC
jgi:Family of unknown function (DUF6345)